MDDALGRLAPVHCSGEAPIEGVKKPDGTPNGTRLSPSHLSGLIRIFRPFRGFAFTLRMIQYRNEFIELMRIMSQWEGKNCNQSQQLDE